MDKLCSHIFFLILTNSLIAGVYSASTFTLVNKCGITVWPGILSNAGIATLSTTGFALQSGESRTINAPTSWGGRFWGRTHCSEDSAGKFSCVTGDCGSGKVECTGGAAPPATLAEFTLNGDAGRDFYDVSLVDGYNLPMLVAPQGGSRQNCTNTGCVRDLNGACPSELRVTSSDGTGVACKSACEAFRSDEYCCSGAYATPDTCSPSQYSLAFKSACPSAYSYAYDDRTSTFTCIGADYIITFCPSPNTRVAALEQEVYDAVMLVKDSVNMAVATRWYDGLVNKDTSITNEIYSLQEVEFDRQELRRFVRNVHSTTLEDDCSSLEENSKADVSASAANARKSLNRFLCNLVKQLSAE